MLTKLKHTGVKTQDLVEIYSIFIRSRAEYMSVVWHSSLTVEEANKIANIQKTCLKVFLGDTYTDYKSSLERLQIQELSVRREACCLSFARKSVRTSLTAAMFPENPKKVMIPGAARNIE